MNQSDFFIGAFLSTVVQKGRVALIESGEASSKLFIVETNNNPYGKKFYVKYSKKAKDWKSNGYYWSFNITEKELQLIIKHEPDFCLVCGDIEKEKLSTFGYLCYLPFNKVKNLLSFDSNRNQWIRVETLKTGGKLRVYSKLTGSKNKQRINKSDFEKFVKNQL